jgi:hypothetical protein
VHFFSYETWYILQDVYMEKLLKEIDVEYKYKVEAKDVNRKYLS